MNYRSAHSFRSKIGSNRSKYQKSRIQRMVHETMTSLGFNRYFIMNEAYCQFGTDHALYLGRGKAPTDNMLRIQINAVYGATGTMQPINPPVYLKKDQFYRICADGYDVLKPLDGQIMRCTGVMVGGNGMVVYIMRSSAIRKGQQRYTRFIFGQAPFDNEPIYDIFRPLGKEGYNHAFYQGT